MINIGSQDSIAVYSGLLETPSAQLFSQTGPGPSQAIGDFSLVARNSSTITVVLRIGPVALGASDAIVAVFDEVKGP